MLKCFPTNKHMLVNLENSYVRVVLYTLFNKHYSVKLITRLGGCYICEFIILTSEQNKILDLGLNKYTCMHNLRRNLTIYL